jgi:hypothetical protein
VAYTLVIALVPANDDELPELPLLTRARLLVYPYIRRDSCEERFEADGECGCGCLWDDAKVGSDYYRGCLWLDRYGRLPVYHPVNDPEDEPRLAVDVNLRNTFLTPAAIITPDGEAHPPGGTPGAHWYTHSEYAQLEDLLTDHPTCFAVPFSCHF